MVLALERYGTEGIDEALSVLREYSLLRDDLESLAEITSWPGLPASFSRLDSKVLIDVLYYSNILTFSKRVVIKSINLSVNKIYIASE